MKVGELLRTTKYTYLYQDEPIFPWNKIPSGTLLIVLDTHDPTGKIQVLLTDGRTGWLEVDFLERV